jgi:microcystin-dependent protein
MSTPYLSEIRVFSFGFPPKGWALCNGQLMPINQNPALFSLLGTTYGGNGQTTFALPDLRSRIPMHMGNGHTEGELSGEEAHTLSVSEIPGHTHSVACSSATGGKASAKGNVWAPDNNGNAPYSSPSNTTVANTAQNAIGNTGGSQAHNNLAPFMVLSFCIALTGIFPSRS